MKRIIVIGIFGLTALIALTSCGLLQEPEEASGPIEAIPLEVVEEGSEDEQAAEELADDQLPADEEVEAQPDDAEETTEDPEDSAPAENSSAGMVIFTIDPAQSEVRFEIDEDLRGQRNKVVGVTNQVSGEIGFDSSDPSSTQVGTILVNARTLATDNDFRNRAIQNEILDTADFEFIIFEPTSIEGLPESVGVGDSVTFTIVGDLTIRDITQEATFTIEATLSSENEITGTANTVVTRADFDLNIPSVPNVANVEEEVELYIDFAASGS